MKCPRCDYDKCREIAKAPDGSGAWTVNYCPLCNFSWRSTEEREVVERELRDPWFNLDWRRIEDMPSLAPIPPLKPKGA